MSRFTNSPKKHEETTMQCFLLKKVKKHWLGIFLWTLSIPSTVLIILITYFPDYLFDNYFSINVEKSNELVVNISLSIITSAFFYWLLVWLPDKVKESKSHILILGKLEQLVREMNNVIAYVIYSRHDIFETKSIDSYSNISSNKFTSISPIKFISKDDNELKNREHYLFCSKTKKYEYWVSSTMQIDYNKSIESISTIISDIFNSPVISFEKLSLILLLSHIQQCAFMRRSLCGKDQKEIHGIAEFYELYQALLSELKPWKPSGVYRFTPDGEKPPIPQIIFD